MGMQKNDFGCSPFNKLRLTFCYRHCALAGLLLLGKHVNNQSLRYESLSILAGRRPRNMLSGASGSATKVHFF
jgi:hypothetical protein